MNRQLNAVESQDTAALQKLQAQHNQSINTANANINELKKATDEIFAQIKKRLLFSKKLKETYIKMEGRLEEEAARYTKLSDCFEKFSQGLENSKSDVLTMENLYNKVDTYLQDLKNTKITLESQVESSLVKQKRSQEEMMGVNEKIDQLLNAIYFSNDEQNKLIIKQTSLILNMSARCQPLFCIVPPSDKKREARENHEFIDPY